MAVDEVVAISVQPNEHALLHRLVQAAEQLVPARYAVALLVGPDGIPTALAHRGMAPDDVAALPHLPRPVGLIGAVLAGQTLHLSCLADHPDSIGFPAHHVPMGPMLGLPIMVEGRIQGGLYLTRSPEEPLFTDDAAHLASTLAAHAGTVTAALRNAGAARALMDGLGLTAGRAADPTSPSKPSPALRRIVANARTVLKVDLAFLAHIDGDRQTFVTVDAGSDAPPLHEGTTIDTADGYCGLMLAEKIPPAVPDVRVNPRTAGMSVTQALGVGAYCGVPVHLSDGTIYGSLCGLHGTPTMTPTSAQMKTMETLAGLLGRRLSQEAQYDNDRNDRRAAFQLLLDSGQRKAVVQPIVNLVTGATVGYEALSRFIDPSGAPRRPDHVFTEAAELGLGVPLEFAAAQAALSLLPQLPDATYLSINLSPQAVCDARIYELFHDLPLNRVVLELTEHDQVVDYTSTVQALAGFRERGLRLAIDDAGSGFSGLHHLAELHPNLIKLDIAFVRNIDSDPARRAVARALLGFSDDVGAILIAEGIETPDELKQLRRLGATFGQGFLLGRPVPVAQLAIGHQERHRRDCATNGQ